MLLKLQIVVMLLLITCNMLAQSGTGVLEGIITENVTGNPIPAATVKIMGTSKGGYANNQGKFSIRGVAAAVYSIQVTCVGYQAVTVPDIVIKPGRTTSVAVSLVTTEKQANEVIVTPSVFSTTEPTAVSATSLRYEEIRRSPGSAGDISRVLAGNPAVAKTNDTKNSLLVRGGNPTENTFFVNNIEIPNINHFPTQGSSGGPIGILNIDFIREATFYAGGFDAKYGDKLSSVMDITFRAGSTDNFAAQVDINFAGLGGVIEGPLFSPSASYAVSVRRSYLDLLVKAVNTGTTLAPNYNDYQSIVQWDINNSHRISWLTVASDDHSTSNNDVAKENEQIYYGDQDIIQVTSGINWHALWGNGVSNTSLSYSHSAIKEKFFEAGSQQLLINNKSAERILSLRNVSMVVITPWLRIEGGTDIRLLFNNYNSEYGSIALSDGSILASTVNKQAIQLAKGGVFVSGVGEFGDITLNTGVRVEANSTFGMALTPRLSASYALFETTRINAAVSWFAQSLPAVLLAQNPSYQNLPCTKAMHVVLGGTKVLGEYSKLTIEGYYKSYSDFPMDPLQPELFLLDEISYSTDIMRQTRQLTSNGKARSHGVECTIQHAFNGEFYGLVGIALSKAEYYTMNNMIKNRLFDNQYSMSLEVGYALSPTLEISSRWIIAGGAPYTPFDITASTAANRGIIDGNNIQKRRYPTYHSLNVRVDKRWLFDSSSIVLYISVWNTYNRQNIANYYWNSYQNKQGEQKQFGILPIFGVEWEL